MKNRNLTIHKSFGMVAVAAVFETFSWQVSDLHGMDPGENQRLVEMRVGSQQLNF